MNIRNCFGSVMAGQCAGRHQGACGFIPLRDLNVWSVGFSVQAMLFVIFNFIKNFKTCIHSSICIKDLKGVTSEKLNLFLCLNFCARILKFYFILYFSELCT